MGLGQGTDNAYMNQGWVFDPIEAHLGGKIGGLTGHEASVGGGCKWGGDLGEYLNGGPQVRNKINK